MVNDGRPDNGHRGLPRLGGAYASDAVAGDLLGERVRSLVNAAANGALWVPVCGAGSPVGIVPRLAAVRGVVAALVRLVERPPARSLAWW